MKKIFVYIAVLAVAVTASLITVSHSTNFDSLWQANVEALTDNESTVVNLPCLKATSICYFLVKDANGNYYTANSTGLRNV
jgi:hypothetical protein